jgi:hypothetical protein
MGKNEATMKKAMIFFGHGLVISLGIQASARPELQYICGVCFEQYS